MKSPIMKAMTLKAMSGILMLSTFAMSAQASTNKTFNPSNEPTVAGRPISNNPAKPFSNRYNNDKVDSTRSNSLNESPSRDINTRPDINAGRNINSPSRNSSRDRDLYISYPAFGDKEPFNYNDRRVNAVIDKGLVRELIVQCTKELEGIMVHDYTSNVYCDSKNECHGSLSRAINRTCAE